jgi:threonine aldolase
LLKGQKKYKYLPKVIVLTQPTEFGTVYTLDEIKAVCDYAHSKDMYVYIDGARLANAIVELETNLTEMIEGTGVDAFSFGGTKAGALFGEMVVFRRAEFSRALDYSQKQSLQHLDKSKFLGVQIEYLLDSGLWLENAKKANASAKVLEKKLLEKGVKTFYPTQTNMVFAILTEEQLEKINQVFYLHYWNETDKSVRIATTYLTTEEKINQLVSLI